MTRPFCKTNTSMLFKPPNALFCFFFNTKTCSHVEPKTLSFFRNIIMNKISISVTPENNNAPPG